LRVLLFLKVFNRIRTIIRRRANQGQEALFPMDPCGDEKSSESQSPSELLLSDPNLIDSQTPLKVEDQAITAAQEVEPPVEKQVETKEKVESSKKESLVETNQETEEHACKADATQFCPSETASHSIFNVFQCLQTHSSELTAQCKEKVEQSPVFNCAMDALKFCSNMPQASVPGCLRQHFKELSDTCVHQIIHHTPGQHDVESVSASTDAAPALLSPHGDTWTGKFLNMLNTATVAKVVSILVFISLLVICSAVVYICSRRKRVRQSAEIRLQMLQPPVIASV